MGMSKGAVVTALISGAATVVAGLLTYWLTTKEPELSYAVVSGPAIVGPAGAKRILVVEARNTGSREVRDARVLLSLPNGNLAEVTSAATPGVELSEKRTDDLVDIKADVLNPGDTIKVSVLASGANLSEPRVVVRAPGVQGVSTANQPKNSEVIDVVTMIIATTSIAAVLSTLLSLTRLRSKHRLGLSKSLDQAELCAFICSVCKLHTEAYRIRFGGREISYRGAADYLVERADICDASQRLPHIVAMKCLLLTKGVARLSVETIISAIQSLDPEFTGEAANALRKRAIDEGDRPVEWRKAIQEFCSEELASRS